MKSSPLTSVLDKRTDLRRHLFEKGFLITNDSCIEANGFPLYAEWWNMTELTSFRVFSHKETPLYTYAERGVTFILFGHAYNPFAMETDEAAILRSLAQALRTGGRAYYDKLDELTGIFMLCRIHAQQVFLDVDASGMQFCCYGLIGGKTYIASHMRILGDILSLETDDYVKRLISYRWYHYMMGNYLPGDLTAFSDVKRVLPNTTVTIGDGKAKISRFYPYKPLKMCKTEADYQAVIQGAAEILQNTMKLISEKWQRPAISLTGGIDSNTTFAAANGLYNKFTAFSYVSLPREQVDADAAKRISDEFHVPHTVYHVNASEPDADFEIYKKIFIHNDGEIGTVRDNDVHKRIMLIKQCDVDVEVKSWISETIRAYAYKYFGRTKMPKVLKPRHYTSLYKIFLANRALALQTDRHFARYLQDTRLHEFLFNYDESDFFVWEMMHGGKCGLNIGVMKSCFDITIPYNNRKLLDLLLTVPLADRISDRHHLDLKKAMNRKLYDMNIRIVNLNETKKRKRAINLYYIIHTHIPF